MFPDSPSFVFWIRYAFKLDKFIMKKGMENKRRVWYVKIRTERMPEKFYVLKSI